MLPSTPLRLLRRLRCLTSAAVALPALALVAGLLGARPVRAQGGTQVSLASPASARGAVWFADSIAADGDTARAMAILDSVVRTDRRNAAAWHRRGMIRWANARSRRSGGFIRDKQVIKWLQDADSSLRLARLFAPDSARYAVDLGRFLLNSGTATQRFAARGFFEKGLEAAERTGTPWQRAEAADELGMTHWRRYENVARRALTGAGSAAISGSALDSLGGNPSVPGELRGVVQSMLHQVEGESWMGRDDYERAIELFRHAIELFPDHPAARRHYYMALAERDRWDELATVASARAKTAIWDSPTHLARGLALHRLGRGVEAQAAFDSALVLLTDQERQRLTNVARLLRTARSRGGQPSDSALYESLQSGPVRARADSMYWAMADPLALTPENEHRNEFLARVAYAELRWTQDDLDRRGADSDRGEVWIRYGPPDIRFSSGANGFDGNSETWLYRTGAAFTFNTPASFGTGRYAQSSWTRAQELKATRPASWANVAIDRRIDSIHVQLARFRAVGDSADLVMVAELPVDSLLAGLDVTRAAVDVGMGMWTGPSVVLLRDSTRVMVDPTDKVNAPRLRAWRERLPAGDHVYRFEALQPDGLRGARALGKVSLRGEAGFGASDLLVAERVAPREGVAPRRWRDLIVAPNAATFARGQPIGLVWETYGLQAGPEGARYRVVVTVERRFENKASAFVANVVGGVAGATGLSAKENNKGRAALRFERSAPASDVALDWLTLDIGNAAPGRYLVSVEVTDLVANRATTLSRMVRIR